MVLYDLILSSSKGGYPWTTNIRKDTFFLADSNGALVFDEERRDKYGEMDQDGEVALMLWSFFGLKCLHPIQMKNRRPT